MASSFEDGLGWIKLKHVPMKGLSRSNLFHHLQQRQKVQYEECVEPHAALHSEAPCLETNHQTTFIYSFCALCKKWVRNGAILLNQWPSISPRTWSHSRLSDRMASYPRYQSLCRNYFMKVELPKMYTDVREREHHCLAGEHVSLCVDHRPVVQLRAKHDHDIHFMDDWYMKSASLQTT